MKTELLTPMARWRINVPEDFNFRLSLWKPSHFCTGLETHSDRSSWRTFMINGSAFGVRFRRTPRSVVCDVFGIRGVSKAALDELRARVIWSYGLHEDVASFDLQFCAQFSDERFGPVCGMRISRPESVFESAILSVLLQNTTVQRTTQMLRSMLRLAGGVACFDGVALARFFTPEELATLSTDELRADCRVGYRAQVLADVAAFFANGPEIPREPSELMIALQAIRGIGPYSAAVVATAATRDPSAAGLDSWNTRIAAEAMGLHDDVDRETVSRGLTRRFPGHEGLALLYMTELEYLSRPVDPIAPSDDDARRRSIIRAESWFGIDLQSLPGHVNRTG